MIRNWLTAIVVAGAVTIRDACTRQTLVGVVRAAPLSIREADAGFALAAVVVGATQGSKPRAIEPRCVFCLTAAGCNNGREHQQSGR